jgi:serine/threonine-protein kinase
MPSIRRSVLVFTLAVATTSGVARADGLRADAPRAEALFEEARRLMASGDYLAACTKFADSQAIDPAPGTALNLAICYEKAGKLASAWAAFRTAQSAAQSARQTDRAKAAEKRAKALEPKLSHLTISVSPDAQVAGLEVRCDDEPVRQAEWQVNVPRDGGFHDITATAPGRKPWKTRIELAASEQSLSVDVPVLEPDVSSAPPPVAPITASTPTPADSGTVFANVSDAPKSNGKVQRIVGLSLGGAGVLAIGVGSFAGLTAHSKYDDATASCGPTTTCPKGSPAFALRDSAVTWATVSTITFVAGGALLAGGAVLYFTAPRTTGPTVGLAPAPGGAAVSFAQTF